MDLQMLVAIARGLAQDGHMTILALLLLVWGLVRVVNNKETPIEWWQFFSSRGLDGQQYADPNRLGILVGMIASTWIVCLIAWEGHLTDSWYSVVVFGLWLLFISGSEAFSKWFRSFLDRRYAAHQAPAQAQEGRDGTQTR